MSHYRSITQSKAGAGQPGPFAPTLPASSRIAIRKRNRLLLFSSILTVLSLSIPAFASGTRRFSVKPTSISFGTTALNTTTAKSLTITSTGTGSITIKSIASTGVGFSMAPVTLPVTLNPGKSLSVQVRFDPTAAGTYSGNVTITTNSYKQPSLKVPLSGTGASGTPTLSLSTTSINFGNDPVGTSISDNLTLSSTGTAPVTLNSSSISGPGFSMSGATFPVTLNPGIAITIQVGFDPTAAGSDTGNLSFSTNSSTGSPAKVSLSGTGTSTHSVALSWAAPTSSPVPVSGYYVFRAAAGSTSFQRLNPSVDVQTTYSDQNVQAGASYTYYVKSVDSSGTTSVASKQVVVTIP